MDACGNSATCTQTIWIKDTVPPTIQCPVDITVACATDIPAPDLSKVYVNDNCSGSTTKSWISDEEVNNGCSEHYVHRKYKAVDACGNISYCTQTIWVKDTVPPSIQCPANITVACITDVPNPNTKLVSGYDNCGSVTRAWVNDYETNTSCTNHYIDRVYKVTDECNNTSTCTQRIWIKDTIPPSILCPVDITVTCQTLVPAPNPASVTASDNCNGEISVTWVSDFEVNNGCAEHYITRTYKATDVCGNSSTCTQKIWIIDNIPPTIQCPSNITVACQTDAPAPDVNLLIVDDNCTGDLIKSWVSDNEVNNGCNDHYITRTYKVMDACGNTATCMQTIWVKDTIAPMIVLPPNITVACQTDVPAPDTMLISGSDNCSSIIRSWVNDSETNEGCNYHFIDRTYKVTDACGNYTTGTQRIWVKDTIPPTIQVPADITVACQTEVPLQDTSLVYGSDNCGNITKMWVKDIETNDGCNYHFIDRTYKVTDECDNSTTGVQRIWIRDTIAPTIDVPADITVACTDEVPVPDTLLVTGSDNCTDMNGNSNIIRSWVKDTEINDGCEHHYIDRTYMVTDYCGNTTTGIQRIWIKDTIPPIINVPADITVACNDEVPVPDTLLVSGSDNCGGIIRSWEGDLETNDGCEYHFIDRTYSVTDECGNSTTGVQRIWIRDTIAPTIMCPVNITVACSTQVPAPDTLSVSGSDNCSAISRTWISDTETDNGCLDHYIDRIYQVMDACGNTNSCTQRIWIRDTIAPSILCPANLTVQCSEEVPVPDVSLVDASDNCTEVVPVIWLSDVVSDSTCANHYIVTRTYKATDACGNTATCQQTITVYDNIAPSIECPANLTVQCSEEVPAPDVNLVESSDNCTSGSTVSWVSDEVSDSTCANHYTVTRTYKATDACGNSASCQQIITVHDITPPSIDCPANLTVQCAEEVPAPDVNLVESSDNCTSGSTVSWVNDVVSNYTCTNHYTVTRTYMATDACGNTATCAQIITVNDNIAPSIECPADLTVQCSGDVPAPDISQVDASDNCTSGVTVSWVSDEVSDSTCTNHYTVTRTYMATDACGNTATCEQIITVDDNTAPIIEITDTAFAGYVDGGVYKIQCRSREPGWQLPTLKDEDIQVTDNCGSATFTLTTDVSDGDCTNDGYFKKLKVKILATDECGNQSQKRFTILIVDTIAPHFTILPPDLSLNCANDLAEYEIKAEDECECTYISYEDRKINLGCQGTYKIIRKYKAVDCCENASYYTQTITVTDTTAPQIQAIIPELKGIQNGGDVDIFCNKINNGAYPVWVGLPANQLITGVDLCTHNLTYNKTVEALPDGNCAYYGYISGLKITLSVADDCGNETSMWFTVKLRDTMPPDIINFSPTVCSDDNQILWAEDGCSNVYYNYFDEPVTGECGQGTNYIRTWTLTDDCANDTIVTQYVVTNDHTPPVIKFRSDYDYGFTNGQEVLVNCDQWVSKSKPQWLNMIYIPDTCDQAKLDVTVTETPGSCQTDGYNRLVDVTWYATDACGNVGTFTLHYKITDDTPPVFDRHESQITVDCVNKIPAVHATDACSSAGEVNLTVDRQEIAGACANQKTIIENYTATDKCGNIAHYSRTINLIDTTGPVIMAKSAICASDVNDVITAYDDCTGAPALVSITDDPTQYACGGGYYTFRTLSASDACGNTTVRQQQVIHNDVTPPELEWDDNMINIINTTGDEAIVGCADYDRVVDLIRNNGGVKATDDCQASGFSQTVEETVADPICTDGLVEVDHTFKFTVSDICGNTAVKSLVVRKLIHTDFTLDFLPADTTIYCTQTLPWVSDDIDLGCGMADFKKEQGTPIYKTNGDWIEVRKYTITDICGKQHTKIQNVYHDMTSDISCSIFADGVIKCNSSDNILFAEVEGGSPDYTYYWEIVNGSCHLLSGQGTPKIKISVSYKTLMVRLTVIDQNGCKTVCYYTADCKFPDDPINGGDLDHRTLNAPRIMSVRPNPSTGIAFLDYEVNQEENAVVYIMDNIGAVVNEEKVVLTKGGGSLALKTEKLTPGVYFIRVIGDKHKNTLKLVIVK
jgi:hypothetical protein